MESRKKFITTEHLVLAVFMLALFGSLACIFVPSYKALEIESSHEIIPYDEDWYIVQDNLWGDPFTAFGEKLDCNEITLVKLVAPDSDWNDTLGFFNNYSAVEVYVDDFLVYSYGSSEQLEKGILLGNIYCMVGLEIFPGQAAELKVRFVSDDRLTLSGFDIGTPIAMAGSPYSSSLLTIFAVVIAMASIVVLLILAIYGKNRTTVTKNYYYLMLFIMVISLWGISDTQLLPVLGFSPVIVCIISYESFMLMVIPFLLFMYTTCRTLRKLDLGCMVLLFLNFLVLNVLHFSGIMSLRSSVSITHVCQLVTLVAILLQTIMEYRSKRTSESIKLLVGFSVICGSAVLQFIMFTIDQSRNRTGIIEIGLIIFIGIQFLQVIRNLFDKAEEGYKADVYLEMAKTDSLTQLGNRRALDLYIDDLKNIRHGNIRLGCIVCDLNNMKETNDKYGHTAGDQLLKEFAGCLVRCFEGRGTPFRTGGDEFYVLFSRIEVDMNAMLTRMGNEIERFNRTSELKINTSSGASAAYVDSSDPEAVWRIIKEADDEMYICKRNNHRSRRYESY